MPMSERCILVVARWPLGGIRTYMRYMFSHFPPNYRLTLLAASTQEDAALIRDAEKYNAQLKIVRSSGISYLIAILKELHTNRYDVILSQGFVSAVAASLANLFNGIPHILTIHGIVEPKYVGGRFGALKRWLLGRVLGGITVLYGVSNDILEHVYHEFPQLRHNGPQPLVILNGIDPSECDAPSEPPLAVRRQLGIDASVFLFGYFGRFMPEKGFDLLIEAVDQIRSATPDRPIAVVAVGSGDYLREYQALIHKKRLESYFYFVPFQPAVHQLYPQVDAVVIPSRCEACPLLPMEVLCMGTPLITSDCIGLREVIAGTPALVFRSEDLAPLVERMQDCLMDDKKTTFATYAGEARKRFDVAGSAEKLVQFIGNTAVRG